MVVHNFQLLIQLQSKVEVDYLSREGFIERRIYRERGLSREGIYRERGFIERGVYRERGLSRELTHFIIHIIFIYIFDNDQLADRLTDR